MIEFENKLEEVNPELHKVVFTLWRNLHPYTVQILAGKCSEEEARAIVTQGSSIKEVNEARSAIGLHQLESKLNKKIAKPKFADYLKKGEGVLLVIRSNGFRHKANNDIRTVLSWLEEMNQQIAIEVVSNDRYDSFFFHMKRKKEKQEEVETINAEGNE